jgi:hypothetical protein
MLESPSGGIKMQPRAAHNPLSGAVPELPGDDKVPLYTVTTETGVRWCCLWGSGFTPSEGSREYLP